ncbi:hypothetical protein ABPG74_020457, partial [Tetrahymena malaccensis]
MIQNLTDQMFRQQVDFSKQFTSTISFQISNQIQRMSSYIYIINNFYSKAIEGKVKGNPKHISSYVNLIKLLSSQNNTYLTNVMQNNPFSLTSWYHKNFTQISKLDEKGKSVLQTFQLITPLMRAIDIDNQFFYQGVRKLQFQDTVFGMQEQGIFISQASKFPNTDNSDNQDCGPGLFKYDPRCRFWYQNALQYKSLSQNKPDFLYYGGLAQNLCQKSLYFDQQLQQNLLHHVMCFTFPLNNTSSYFQNFVKSTKQLYMIEPLSQTIVYDSKHQMINFEVLNFQETELQYLQDRSQAQNLNNTLNKLYSKFVIDEVHQIKQIDLSQYYKNITTIQYQRNGSDYTVILNPIHVIAKVPPNNIIDDKDQISIDQDKQIDLLNIFDDKSLKPYDFFSSKETKELYESFINVFQILVYTTDNFFCVNETLILLRLSKELEYFKQFQNISAVGITHNHIGSILISQQHYFQAMEHFSQSILFAKYEIQNYCKSIQDPFDLNVLHSFCFHQKNHLKIINHNYEQKKILKQSNSFSNKYIESPIKFTKESTSMIRFQQSTAIAQDFVEQTKLELESVRKSNNQLNSQDSSFRYGFNKIHKQSQTKNNKISDEIDSQHNQLNYLNKVNQNSQLCFQQRIQSKETKFRIQNSSIKKQPSQLSQQSTQLLKNLFYRKKNYVIALIAFQEDFEDNLTKKDSQLLFNFWDEIKILLKELIQISQYLPNQIQNKIELKIQIAKSYFKQNNFMKSNQIISGCEKELCDVQFQMNFKRQINKKNSNYTQQSEQKKYRKISENLRQNRHFTICQEQINLSQKRSKSFHSKMKFTNQQQKDATQILSINKNNSLTFLPKYITYSPERKQAKRQTDNSLKNDQSYDHFFKNPSIQNFRIQKQNILCFNQWQSCKNGPCSLKDIQSNNQIDDKIFVDQNQQNEFTLTQFDQNVQNYYEENEFANLSLSCSQLQFLINFAKAEQAIQQQDYYTGASILTQILEEQKTFMSHQPFQIINKLLQIFQKYKIFSQDLVKISDKFNPQIQQKVGIVFGLQKDENSQQKQLNIIQTLLDVDSNMQNDKIGMIFQDQTYGGYFIPYMNLVQINSDISEQNSLEKIDFQSKFQIQSQELSNCSSDSNEINFSKTFQIKENQLDLEKKRQNVIKQRSQKKIGNSLLESIFIESLSNIKLENYTANQSYYISHTAENKQKSFEVLDQNSQIQLKPQKNQLNKQNNKRNFTIQNYSNTENQILQKMQKAQHSIQQQEKRQIFSFVKKQTTGQVISDYKNQNFRKKLLNLLLSALDKKIRQAKNNYTQNKNNIILFLENEYRLVTQQINQFKGQVFQNNLNENSIQTYIIQQFYSKLKDKKVIINQQYIPPLANTLKLEDGIEDDDIKKLFLNNPTTVSYWFQSQTKSNTNQLSFNFIDFDYLSQLSMFTKPFQIERNKISSETKQNPIQTSQPFFAIEYAENNFQEQQSQFIIVSPYLMRHLPQSLNDINCQINIQQKFDLNCFEWFQQAKIQENYFNFLKIDNDSSSELQKDLKSFISCKNIYTQQIDKANYISYNLIMCYQVQLNLNDTFFQIVQGSINNFKILYFHINQEEIINNYSQYICNQSQNLQTQQCLQDNSLKQQIQIIDQSFKDFQEISKQNIFENSQYQNEQRYQDDGILIESMPFQIYNTIINPISYLIDLFKQIQTQPEDVKELIIIEDKIFGDLKAEEIFGSRDTLTLYESLKNLIKMLKYRQQNIFLDNSCKTLLSMTIQTQFFKRFTNYQELGILYNNIANIHFFEHRYFEALENYQSSIICAKIQLQYYQDTISKKNIRSYFQTSIVCSIKHNKKSVASHFESQNITLIENLFNRKYNYYKCLLAYYEKQGFRNVLWEELEQLLNELDNLGSFLEFSHGRNIFLELDICFIKYSTNDIQKAKIQLEKVKKQLQLKEELDQIQIRSKDQNNFDRERVYATKLIQRYHKVNKKNSVNQNNLPSEMQNFDQLSQIKRKKKQSYSKLVKNYKEERENYNQIQFLKYFASQKKISVQNISQNTIKNSKHSNFQKKIDSKTKLENNIDKVQTVKNIQNNQKQGYLQGVSFNMIVHQEKQKAQSQFTINAINKDQKSEEDTNLHKKQSKPLNCSFFNKQEENKLRFSFQTKLKEDSKENETCPKYSLTSIQNIEPKSQEKQIVQQSLRKLIKFQKMYKKINFFKDIDQRLIQNYDYPIEIMKSYYTIIESQILMKEGYDYQAAKIISKSLKNSTCYQTYPKQKLLRFLENIFKQNINFDFEPLKKQISMFDEITIFKMSLFVFCKQDINKYISYQICQEIIDQVMTNEEDSLGVLAYLQDIDEINQPDEIMQILSPIKKAEINNNREFVEDNLILLLDFLQEKQAKSFQQTKYQSDIEILNPPILKKNVSIYSKYSASPKSIYSNSPIVLNRKPFQSFDTQYEQNEKRQSYGNFYQLNNTHQESYEDAYQNSNIHENFYQEKSKTNTVDNYHNQSVFLQSSFATSKNTQNNSSYLDNRFSISSNGVTQQYNNSKFMVQDSILNESGVQQVDEMTQYFQSQSNKEITIQIQEKVNLIIHLGLRKSIMFHLFNNSFLNYQLCKKQFQNNKQALQSQQKNKQKDFKKDLNFPKKEQCQINKINSDFNLIQETQKSQQADNQQDFAQQNKVFNKVFKKFIILLIDQEGLKDNILYKELCSLLKNTNVELLFLQMGENQQIQEQPAILNYSNCQHSFKKKLSKSNQQQRNISKSGRDSHKTHNQVLVAIQIKCVQLIAAQGISIQAYVLRKQLFKLSGDQYNYNSKYVPLLLNQELVYQNKEDPIKTQIALQNEYYASNWYSDYTLIYSELDGLSQQELERNDKLNYILRAYVHQYLNQKNSTLNLGYQIFAYDSNGVFFSNYMNTTFSNQVDNPECPKTKYPFNTRCRFWYLASQKSPGMVVYPPLPILSFYGEQQLVNLICQRTLDRSQQLYAVFCDYMFVDDLKKFFRGYQNIKTHQMIFDPQSFVAIYDSRQDLDISKMTKLQDLLEKSIGPSKQLNEFYKMIQNKYSNRLIKTEKQLDFTNTITDNSFQQQYYFQDDNQNNYLVIFNLLFTVEKLDSEVDNDKNSYNSTYPNKFNYINIYILMDLLSEQELMSFSNKILDQLKIVFILTIVILGVLLIIVICIILQYSMVFSHMIEYPVDRLIKIFNNIQLNLDDINEFIIAQNTQFLDQQSEYYSIFYSEDTKLLYESFTSLVKMLRYSALNLLKEDPSENLLNLNLQINFFDKFQNKQSLGICHNNLANIHFLQGRYLEALDHYERSIIYAYKELNIYKEEYESKSKTQQQRLSKFLSMQRQTTTQTKTSLHQNQKKKMDTSNNFSPIQDQGLKKKDMNEMLQTRIEKQELIENLFNRKFNMFKCLNAYYQKEIRKEKLQNFSDSQQNQSQDQFYIEELITLANELLKISSKLQDENLGREIILRIYILEYQLILDEQKQAEIQYDIIKNLYDKKLIDEQDSQFALEQSVRGQSFHQVRNKNSSLISQQSDKSQQNPQYLKKEAKLQPFVTRQNNLIKETTSILFNKSIDTNNQIDKQVQARKNSAIIKL